MSTEAWQTFGNIVNTAGLTGFAITGATTVLAGYNAYASPCASLAESHTKLEEVRSRIQGLSPQRREEIDSRCGASNCKSLKDLEVQLNRLMDTYYRLSRGSNTMSVVERHMPCSEFRKHVRKFVRETGGLFDDTMTTTVPHLDDMGFDPPNLRLAMDRSSRSESSSACSHHPASYADVEAQSIPMTRVVTV